MFKLRQKFKLTSHEEELPEINKLSIDDDVSTINSEKKSSDTSGNMSNSNSNATTNSASTAASTSTNGSSTNGNNNPSSGTNENVGGNGLLTIKIYHSDLIKLPIKIKNDKNILTALASNAINETSKSSLLDKISKLDDSEFIDQDINSKYLPSIISIPDPNSKNQLIRSLLYLTVEFENNVLVVEPINGDLNNSTWNQVISFDVTKTLKSSSNNSNFLNLNLFVKLPNILCSHKNDLLIGSIKLPLNLKFHNKSIRLLNHEYLEFSSPLSMNDNEEAKVLPGKIQVTIDFKPIIKKSLSIEEFDLLKVIGKGSFGKVMQVIKKDTKQIYALKTIRKQHIISRMEVIHTLAERTVLAKINNPFIVPLKFSFQSKDKLYLVLSFINGGELFYHLQQDGKFSMDRSRFYIAELLSALESLHELNVIYRDLKPENILLDYQGHIALCDFGLCKLNMNDSDKTNTFCGTPEYLAPELILNQGYTRSVDWWTLGTLLYEMLTGLPPFYDEDHNTMYKKILKNPLKFPSFLENTDAKELLVELLKKDPTQRLSDPVKIKNHPFFKDIDWVKLNNKSYLPPFKPNVENLLDTSNFDAEFTNEKPQDSVVDDYLSESVQKQFGGWTYNGDRVL
ncbi:serine/threonine-protein kinase Ypk1p [[Candida] jaroonii]|uniref:Serine/threonine-protein kinase Ypk1p n=1 Tax=[Candida] jaroonii TaxID=467808 RepID=A0ACA9Y7M7_9ASCO|nr:serine/threonine-protein kinase Ypk1p [[Candida] jaroonii]